MNPVRTLLAAVCITAAATAQTFPSQTPSEPVPFQHPDGTTHWYVVVPAPAGISWKDANDSAAELGGYLATITSAAENTVCATLAAEPTYWVTARFGIVSLGPWIGGAQPSGSAEPAGGWGWAELEPFGYANWYTGQPDDSGRNGSLSADRISFGSGPRQIGETWVDANQAETRQAYIVEYSGQTSPLTLGVVRRTDDATIDGYYLVNTLSTGRTHLMDTRGRVVHTFDSQYTAGTGLYLKPNGNLLRAGDFGEPAFLRGGRGGIVEEIDWTDQVVWSYVVSSPTECQHHDLEILPNGNILMMVWEEKTAAEAIAMGRDPNNLPDGELWPEKIIEVDPTTDQVVWEWHAWDHLIQDFDPTKPNFGAPALNPGRIDVNWTLDGAHDWLHFNAIDYNPQLDQIVVSVHTFSELWIIDHSTTSAEAATSSGGRSGKGGDLLYRWGNPQTYGRGKAADQILWRQHDTHWIEPGLPGAGNILIFNNGFGRPGDDFSEGIEIVPPTPDPNGNYFLATNQPWGPVAPLPSIQPNDIPFFSSFTSGLQRLPSGNTLLCGAWLGKIVEVDPAGNVHWEFNNADRSVGAARQGDRVIPPNQAAMFRSPLYEPSFVGFQGKNLTPGAPLEQYDRRLLIDGGNLPCEIEKGSAVDLSLISTGDGGKLYAVALSGTPGLLPIDLRYARMEGDQVFEATLGQTQAGLQNFVGLLDTDGKATATVTVPNNQNLVGFELYATFFVIDQLTPRIGTISNTVRFVITD